MAHKWGPQKVWTGSFGNRRISSVCSRCGIERRYEINARPSYHRKEPGEENFIEEDGETKMPPCDVEVVRQVMES